MKDTSRQKRKRDINDDLYIQHMENLEKLEQLKRILKSKTRIESKFLIKRAEFISEYESIHTSQLYYDYIKAENKFIQTYTLLVNARFYNSIVLLEQYQESYWKAFIAKNNASSKYYKAKIKKYELKKCLTQTKINLDVATIDVALAQEELDWFKLKHF